MDATFTALTRTPWNKGKIMQHRTPKSLLFSNSALIASFEAVTWYAYLSRPDA
ncbi:hypothetical protein SAMN04488135_10428 [Pollutimonas bauzanensis]|uniref:Uncharacterized protein n=2 Tax=Pollutimonas bauzanensis TaxID=658167 RepID=A0A1M5UKN7_9BURK|nr:hypothetical protein SAMN04488135_10428 [Pollutimonas bauzanensis]